MADLAALVLPWTALTAAVVLLLVAPSTEAGVLLAASGVLFAVAQCRRYPFPASGVAEVTRLLDRMDASPVHGVPVEVSGRIVGRDVPGFQLCGDLVLQDDSGIVALDYRQPFPFSKALFGFTKAKRFLNQDVVVRGWYRRTPEPVIELRELRSPDGAAVRPHLWLARFIVAGVLVVAGLWVTSHNSPRLEGPDMDETMELSGNGAAPPTTDPEEHEVEPPQQETTPEKQAKAPVAGIVLAGVTVVMVALAIVAGIAGLDAPRCRRRRPRPGRGADQPGGGQGARSPSGCHRPT